MLVCTAIRSLQCPLLCFRRAKCRGGTEEAVLQARVGYGSQGVHEKARHQQTSYSLWDLNVAHKEIGTYFSKLVFETVNYVLMLYVLLVTQI